ncbi:MAG: glutamate 5-kinase [Candidatus Omnitrophota bacterium]|nr:glutamate 5-kinase [Candidatus Omnitrophota bacterium]
MRDNFLSNLKLVVVKVGTSTFTSKSNPMDRRAIKNISRQVCELLDKGIKVVLVSSGAIGAGMHLLGLKSRPRTLEHLQAAAAIGQTQLMKAYDEYFKEHRRKVAQVLLIRDDLEERKRCVNVKSTIFTILEYGAVPIINENDTVSADEIKIGDNDTLASLVTKLLGADLLIILSDVDGLYSHMGKKEVVDTVKEIDRKIEELACGTDKDVCVGGMSTKIKAAKVVTEAGIPMVIANGQTEEILTRIVNKERVGTIFIPRSKRSAS